MAHRPCFMGAGCGRVDVEPCGDLILGGVGGASSRSGQLLFPERNRTPTVLACCDWQQAGPKLGSSGREGR